MNQIVMNMGTGGTQTTSYAITSPTVRASKEEIDRLFETVLTLSNYAHEQGLEDAANHLENALDSLM